MAKGKQGEEGGENVRKACLESLELGGTREEGGQTRVIPHKDGWQGWLL